MPACVDGQRPRDGDEGRRTEDHRPADPPHDAVVGGGRDAVRRDGLGDDLGECVGLLHDQRAVGHDRHAGRSIGGRVGRGDHRTLSGAPPCLPAGKDRRQHEARRQQQVGDDGDDKQDQNRLVRHAGGAAPPPRCEFAMARRSYRAIPRLPARAIAAAREDTSRGFPRCLVRATPSRAARVIWRLSGDEAQRRGPRRASGGQGRRAADVAYAAVSVAGPAPRAVRRALVSLARPAGAGGIRGRPRHGPRRDRRCPGHGGFLRADPRSRGGRHQGRSCARGERRACLGRGDARCAEPPSRLGRGSGGRRRAAAGHPRRRSTAAGRHHRCTCGHARSLRVGTGGT